MNIHHNARLTPLGRERMVRAIVEGGQTPQAAARAAGVCPRTARKWVARFKAEGLAGLADRSSRPQRLRQPTSPAVVDQVIALRRQRLPGQHIAKTAGVSPATVSRILKRAGLSRLKDLEPPEPNERAQQLQPWTHAYNWHRPHGSLKANTPISRFGLSGQPVEAPQLERDDFSSSRHPALPLCLGMIFSENR